MIPYLKEWLDEICFIPSWITKKAITHSPAKTFVNSNPRIFADVSNLDDRKKLKRAMLFLELAHESDHPNKRIGNIGKDASLISSAEQLKKKYTDVKDREGGFI